MGDAEQVEEVSARPHFILLGPSVTWRSYHRADGVPTSSMRVTFGSNAL
jgi:hypothetical protein